MYLSLKSLIKLIQCRFLALLSSSDMVCKLYTCRLPSSMTATRYRPPWLTAALLILFSTPPTSNRSLQVWILMKRIIPSWLKTPRVYKRIWALLISINQRKKRWKRILGTHWNPTYKKYNFLFFLQCLLILCLE